MDPLLHGAMVPRRHWQLRATSWAGAASQQGIAGLELSDLGQRLLGIGPSWSCGWTSRERSSPMLRNSARALDRTASQISQLSQPCVEAQRGPKPEVQHRAAQSDLQSCLRVAAVRGHCLHSAPAPGLGEPLLLSVPPPSQATCFHMLTCWPADTESSPIPRVRVPCFFCWCRHLLRNIFLCTLEALAEPRLTMTTTTLDPQAHISLFLCRRAVG